MSFERPALALLARVRLVGAGMRFLDTKEEERGLSTNALMIRAQEKRSVDFGELSVCWKVDGNHTGGRFALWTTRLPHAHSAPRHDRHNEDELSYGLTGRLG